MKKQFPQFLIFSLLISFVISCSSSGPQKDPSGDLEDAISRKEVNPESTTATVYYSSSSSSSSVDKAPEVELSKKTKGFIIKTVKKGKGPAIKNGQQATVQYTGRLTNGKKFDSSYDHGKAFTFTVGVGQVIRGWDFGVEGMKVGEKRKLTVPPELGYGEQGAGGVIPPNATLLFDVELVKIN